MFKKYLLVLCLGLVACSDTDVKQYRDQKPELELRQFFSGRVEAWGLFQKRSGEVIKRFHVVIDGRSDGDNVVLDEHFTYSDGNRQARTWTIRAQGPGRWRGNAGDVVEEASGQNAGFALRWQYVLSVPVDGKTYEVQFDDWMYLMDERVMLNKAVMTKFGFKLGEVTLTFVKRAG